MNGNDHVHSSILHEQDIKSIIEEEKVDKD